jgi:hypothetical protein
LEREHMNKAGFKLTTILEKAGPKDITVLTFDGSPHCLQLHFAVEQAKDLTKSDVRVSHYVVEHGKVFRVSREAVRTARHLSEVQKLLTSAGCESK